MTLDDLESDMHSWGKDALYGAHRKNLNEDSPILSSAKMWVNDSSF